MTKEQPNILIIYPDQLRYDAMSCAGNPVLRTPHFDRLAQGGVMFENAFCAFPLCAPWRASLLTGKYPHSNGMGANHYPMRLDQPFLAELLRDQAGYQTGYVGKWHLDGGRKHDFVRPEERLGFDWFVGFSRGHSYMSGLFYRNEDKTPRTSRRYESDYQTDHMIEFMDKSLADTNQPFFGMINYGPPHPPFSMPDYYRGLHSPEQISPSPAVPNGAEARRESQEFLAQYYDLTVSIDHCVGRLLDFLDARGIADRTLVVFVSDHGEMAGEHGRYGKKCFHRNSMHVPMIVRYPAAFSGGRRVGALVDPSIDTMPTLLALAGVDVPDCVQGTSYLPLLTGQAEQARQAVYYEICMEREGPEKFPVPERGVRTREWLYVRSQQEVVGLFDVVNDPYELNNLAGHPDCSKVQAHLQAMLDQHMADTGDAWGIEMVFPPPDFQTHEEGDQRAVELLKSAVVEN